jgi:choline dehydrogenase-like flavoprotein
MAGLCATVLDLDQAEAAALGDDVDAFTARLPGSARAAIAAGAVAADAVCLATCRSRMHALDRDGRARFARRAVSGPAASLLDALKIPVLVVHGANAVAADLDPDAAGLPARPDAELDVTSSTAWPSRSVADVVVIGSGAGGAMAARTLARAGLATVILEEGRRFTVDEFRTRPALDRFTDLYRQGGATVMLGRPPVYLPLGRGVGGTTLVNSGTCYRTPDAVLRRWRDLDGLGLADPEAFAPHLDDVERTLQVAPVPLSIMGNNGRLALAGAAALGWSSHALRRNAPGCAGSCQCAIGCPRNAKFGVHLNALPAACAAGARIVSDARVERILHARGRTTGVRVRRPDGSVLEILAERVVVAAGATETPPLLRRSGLGRHPQLGRNLAVHPAVSAAGRFDEPVDATRGVLQSAAIDEFHESDGILMEATSTPPGMGSMVLPGLGAPLMRELAGAGHLATIGAMVADAPSGRVWGSRQPVLSYHLRGDDAARLLKAIRLMGTALFAAGATEVLTGIPGHERVRDLEELQHAVDGASWQRMHIAAFHPTGTARMGADPQRHPVDEHGQLRGVSGTWVADASILPSCPEVNPQVTIMALALAVAEHAQGQTLRR